MIIHTFLDIKNKTPFYFFDFSLCECIFVDVLNRRPSSSTHCRKRGALLVTANKNTRAEFHTTVVCRASVSRGLACRERGITVWVHKIGPAVQLLRKRM